MGCGKVRNQGAAGAIIVGKVTLSLRVGVAVMAIKSCLTTLNFIFVRLPLFTCLCEYGNVDAVPEEARRGR